MELPQKLRDLWSGTRINDNARRREVARRERKAAEDEAVRQSTEQFKKELRAEVVATEEANQRDIMKAASALVDAVDKRRADDPDAVVHRPLPSITVVLITTAAGWLVLSLLHELSDVAAPMFFALNMLITAYPIHRWMVKHSFPSWLGALTSGLTVLIVLALGFVGMGWSVAATVTELQKYMPQMVGTYEESVRGLAKIGFSEDAIAEKLKGIDTSKIISVTSSVLSNTSSVVTLIVVILTGMIFMVMDTPSMHRRLELTALSKPRMALGLSDFAHGIRRYWLVTTVFGLIVAGFDWVALIIIGVPLAGVWALFSFLTNYIPNIGFIVGLLPPAMLAFFQDGWVACVAVIVSYSVLNFVIQSIIQPKFAGDAVGLTPTMSFVSLLLWGWCFGALGTLIALPCSLLVKSLLLDHDPNSRWVNALISNDPEEAVGPPAPSKHS